MLFSFWMNGSDRENTAIFFRWSGMTGKRVHCQMWKYSCKNFGRVFRTKSLTNCDVHFAESLLQTHYRVCKNIMANKEVAYKAETGYTALIKRRIT